MNNTTEISNKASFEKIRYAQCWEDADILLEGLDIQENDVCIGISSAGENCLSMLIKNPSKVIAIDLNPTQIYCLELRVAAYKSLDDHEELLQLIGSRPSEKRNEIYQKCKRHLSEKALKFWDDNPEYILKGIGSVGKFENYFKMFREKVIPYIHNHKRVKKLLEEKTTEERYLFYDKKWNNLRWRLLFKIFFSRYMMGKFGRDPAFFSYVKGSVADKILNRTKHALRELDPSDNPYLHWILTGTHGSSLPLALREENFEVIKKNIHKLEWKLQTIEEALTESGPNSIDKFNLSDIFEYMSPEAYTNLLKKLVNAGRSKGRLAYWNMLAPRQAPPEMQDKLTTLKDFGNDLLLKDKAFFYSAFIVEEIL